VAAKAEKHVTLRPVMARFPYRTTLERFDFGLQPSVDREKLQELATGRCIEHGGHGVFLGPPGTGNTHLAIALGLKAVQPGQRTLFTSAMSWVAALTKASAENRLEERLKRYSRPKRLIIDAIGYIPIDQHGAHLCFQRIARRYSGVPSD
jgi:DNA replication protein DnaC